MGFLGDEGGDLSDMKTAFNADESARLLELVAPVAAELTALRKDVVFQTIGVHIKTVVWTLSDTGRASLEMAFPGGAGPQFPIKEEVLAAARPAKSEPRQPSRSRSKSRDDVPPPGCEQQGADDQADDEECPSVEKLRNGNEHTA